MASAPFGPDTAEPPPPGTPGTLSASVVALCAWLRERERFLAGPGEARDALRAAEIAGVEDPSRLRRGLRLVLCSKPEELEVFDRTFDAFFLNPKRGQPQPAYAPRHSRERSQSDTSARQASDRAAQSGRHAEIESHAPDGEGAPHAFVTEAPSARDDWRTLLARFSAQAAGAEVPEVTARQVRQHLRAAGALVASVHLGHVRRFRPQRTGHRFDLRRTLRASLHTGGDPVALRFLGHPLRNPRFVLLIDGSRSMATHDTLMLAFGYALVQRSRRTHVFLFSTQLRDVTSQLRSGNRRMTHRVTGVDEAWGGGTRIGESLSRFLSDFGPRCLDDETVVIIYSDGLDVGDVRRLERAMREIHRRSAGVIWVNPLAASTGYAPEAQGMRACLRFIDALVGIDRAIALGGLASVAAAAVR